MSFAAVGGDYTDDAGVLAHGIATGVFKNAETRNAEAVAAAQAAEASEQDATTAPPGELA